MLEQLITCVAAAFVATWVLTAMLLPVAPRLGLVDHPGGRKDHLGATPVVGGIAMFLAVVVAAHFLGEDPRRSLAFSLAALVLVVVGVLDDLFDLRWYWRISAQCTAALLMVYVGGVQIEQIGPLVGRGPMSLGALSVPFTVFATVGLINAVNMIDGIDGLAGTLVLAAVLMLGAAAVYSGNAEMLPRVALLVGALLAFLWFNLRRPGQRRARTFMGNGGSALLGFVIAWFSFRLTQNPGHPVSPVLPPFLILFPLLDCLVLIVRRVLAGRSPFHADREHLHHRMLDAGYSHAQVVGVLGGLSLVLGFIAAWLLKIDLPHPWFVVAFLALFGLHYWITARADRACRFFGRLHRLLFLRSSRERAAGEEPSAP